MSVVVIKDSKSTVISNRYVRPRLANELVDLNGVWSITEEAFEPILITDTSEPAEPQLTVTVTALPADNDFVQDWAAIFQTGILGTNTGDICNFQFTKNGSNVSGMSGSQEIGDVSAPYDYIAGLFASTATVAGDVLGIKLWTSNTMSYLNSSLYIVPRNLGPIAGKQTFAMTVNDPDYHGAGPSGSLAGVTYQTNGSNNGQFLASYEVPNVWNADPIKGYYYFGTEKTPVGVLWHYANVSPAISGGLLTDAVTTAATQLNVPVLANMYGEDSDGSWVRYYQIWK